MVPTFLGTSKRASKSSICDTPERPKGSPYEIAAPPKEIPGGLVIITIGFGVDYIDYTIILAIPRGSSTPYYRT